MGILRHAKEWAPNMSFLGVLIACILLGMQAQAHAAPIGLQEGKIKAGLVYNFLKYTSWPENIYAGRDKIKICLLGGDPFSGALDPLQGKTAQHRVIFIREIKNVTEARECHVVFIHQSLQNDVPNLLNALSAYPVLSMSDIKGFSRQGGMVELSTQQDQRIHLYIKKAAVERSQLRIHDRLLKLAEVH